MKFFLFSLVILGFHNHVEAYTQNGSLPVVIWHGMGDSCCNPLSMGSIKKFIEAEVPGTYVLSLEIGNNIIEDMINGFFKPIQKQIEMACDIVKSDKNLMNGFNAMGFSQGGQFLRALVQQCEGIKMHNLISFGGQHQGVFGFPHCPGGQSTLCDKVRHLLDMGAYESFVQNRVVQAQYWHDPTNESEYHQKCIWLPEVNNINSVNTTYKERLMSLNKFVMVMFLNDTMVEPKETEWFGYYVPGQAHDVQKLQDSKLYIEDYLGLRKMDKDNKLEFLSTLGDHLQLSDDWMRKNIVPYLK